MLTLTPLEPRDCPGVLASTGGVVVELDDAGRRVAAFRPFEQEAAGVPLFLAADADRIYVGAGVGGGPRLQARDRVTGAVAYDVFVGDPDSRTGVSVAVLPAAPVGAVRIAVDAPDTPPAVLDAVLRAASLWESAIAGPPMELTVRVNYGPIDGPYGIAGQGGPQTIGPDGLPRTGAIWIDSADVRNPEEAYRVAAHEIGHVLGIGTVGRWYDQVRGPAFVGPEAVRVYGGPVPLSPDRAHWSEAALGDDLMSPILTGPARVSALTLAALRDIGYETR